MPKPSRATEACGACGSSRTLKADYLEAGNGLVAGGVRVTAELALGGRRNKLKESIVAAEVCVECGVVRLRATNIDGLREAWEHTQAPDGSHTE